MSFYWNNYLPLMMIFVVFFGFLVPAPGAALDRPKIELCDEGDTGCDLGAMKVMSSIAIFMQFVLSGLGLKTDDVASAMKEWKGIIYAFTSINFVTGCMAFLAVQLPFEPKELSIGLAIFCAMPTTLSSGAVLVGQADGNVTLALLLTAGTNILGIFTIPFMLKLYLSTNTDVKISPVPMLIKLMCTILFPLLLGKALRQIQPLADYRLANKKWFGIASSSFLVTVPWMKVSSAADEIEKLPVGNIFLLVLCAILLHLFYLAFNTLMTAPLQLAVKERKAVIILTSQKTLPVAVTVISYLDDTWQLGIIVIPVVICHLTQLLIDSLFVSGWGERTAPGGFLGLGLRPDTAKDVTAMP